MKIEFSILYLKRQTTTISHKIFFRPRFCVFTKTWVSLKRNISFPLGCTIANRQVIDYLRTVKLTNSAPLEEECFGASDQEIINGDFTDDLWHKIQAKLSDSQYQALWLFYGKSLH